MNQAAISAIVHLDTESQQMEGPVKTLMNVQRNHLAEVTNNIVTIPVEVISVQMWAALKATRKKVHIATDVKEPPEDAGQQILSASENLFLYPSISCL